MNLTLEISALQWQGVTEATRAYNASLQRDAQGVLLDGQVELTAAEYFSARVLGMCDSWAQQHCSPSGLVFYQRFTAAEKTAIEAAATTDPHVNGFLQRIYDPAPINVTSPKFWGALQYLNERGLLAEDRVDEIAGITAEETTVEVSSIAPVQSQPRSVWRRLFGWTGLTG
jgi:hypothetical protein